MQKQSPEKTKLARKPLNKRKLLFVVAVVLAVAAVLSPYIFFKPAGTRLDAGGKRLLLEVADTPALQEKGLSGRATMSADHGMLFVFSAPADQCFWMKDMHFSLDMVWVNSDKKVIKIEENVSPKTYQPTNPKLFCPEEPAKYVIELNAGQADKLGVHTGQTLKF